MKDNTIQIAAERPTRETNYRDHDAKKLGSSVAPLRREFSLLYSVPPLESLLLAHRGKKRRLSASGISFKTSTTGFPLGLIRYAQAKECIT